MTPAQPDIDVLERLKRYIAEYEDAPYWGGPTRYPAPPEVDDLKVLLTALETLEARMRVLEEALVEARKYIDAAAGFQPHREGADEIIRRIDAALLKQLSGEEE